MAHALSELFATHRPRVIANVARTFGIEAAEEAFQEAAVAALQAWQGDRVPREPAAWLTTAAKNFLRDRLRHTRVVDAKRPLLEEDDVSGDDTPERIADDQLRLIFTCCHPALSRDSQIALTLKVVAGLTVEEIARAFLAPEATMAQRLSRAKRSIEEAKLPYVVPGPDELPARLEAVLAVVYLIFNEGYASHSGPLMRIDLQAEALRLGRLLCDLLPKVGEVYALLALMAFSASRAHTRVDGQGVLLLLSEQDRNRWNRALIKEGLIALQRARALGCTVYGAQAEISACHAVAPTWEETDWSHIVAAYDALMSHAPSPVVEMNRAIAVGMRDGPKAALSLLQPLSEELAGYHLFYATRADFKRRAGEDARADYEQALALATNDSERAFLKRKLT